MSVFSETVLSVVIDFLVSYHMWDPVALNNARINSFLHDSLNTFSAFLESGSYSGICRYMVIQSHNFVNCFV